MQAVLLALLGGLLLLLSFPPFDLAGLAWVACVPLFAALRGQSRRRAFGLGLLFGNVGYTAAVAASIYGAARRYFDHPVWIDAAFSLLAPQLYGALYAGLFAALVVRQLQAPLARRLWSVPATWVAIELLRSAFWHGAPWLLLAHSQHTAPVWIQVADCCGTAGIAFVVLLVNVLVDHLLNRMRGREPLAWRSCVAAVLVVSAVFVYGQIQLEAWRPRTPTLQVGLVQGNIPLEWRASLPGVRRSLQRFAELSHTLADDDVELYLWPENALGFSLNGNDSLARRVSEAVGGAHVLLGAPRVVDAPGTGGRYRNAVFLVDGQGQIVDQYDKMRLTPYAEYAPLPMPWRAADDPRRRDAYEPGERATVFTAGRHRFGVMICFEAVYAEVARTFVAAGAAYLVNVSNDDWFGDHAAVQQHFVASLFRAVENRRYLLRVTNSGQSGVIDPRGVVALALPPGQARAAVATIEPLTGYTLYSRFGDWFAWLSAITLGAAWSRDRWRRSSFRRT